MKEYTLIVEGTQDMPEQIKIDFQPAKGMFITFNKVTSIIDKVAYNLDENRAYIVSKFHISNR